MNAMNPDSPVSTESDSENSTSLANLRALLTEIGLPPGTGTSDDELMLPLSGDAGDIRSVFIKLLALDENVSMLTFSTNYGFGAEPDGLDQARLGAHEATQWVPLGSFQVDDDGSLHFRYTLVVGSTLPEGSMLLGIIGLIDFLQLHFGDYLAQLLAGKIDIALFPELIAAGEADEVG